MLAPGMPDISDGCVGGSRAQGWTALALYRATHRSPVSHVWYEARGREAILYLVLQQSKLRLRQRVGSPSICLASSHALS